MHAWAIKQGSGRLYSGTASTKKLAIAQHIFAYDQDLFERGMPFYQGKPLDDHQKAVWKMCRKRGDEAVKVTISINTR